MKKEKIILKKASQRTNKKKVIFQLANYAQKNPQHKYKAYKLAHYLNFGAFARQHSTRPLTPRQRPLTPRRVRPPSNTTIPALIEDQERFDNESPRFSYNTAGAGAVKQTYENAKNSEFILEFTNIFHNRLKKDGWNTVIENIEYTPIQTRYRINVIVAINSFLHNTNRTLFNRTGIEPNRDDQDTIIRHTIRSGRVVEKAVIFDTQKKVLTLLDPETILNNVAQLYFINENFIKNLIAKENAERKRVDPPPGVSSAPPIPLLPISSNQPVIEESSPTILTEKEIETINDFIKKFDEQKFPTKSLKLRSLYKHIKFMSDVITKNKYDIKNISIDAWNSSVDEVMEEIKNFTEYAHNHADVTDKLFRYTKSTDPRLQTSIFRKNEAFIRIDQLFKKINRTEDHNDLMKILEEVNNEEEKIHDFTKNELREMIFKKDIKNLEETFSDESSFDLTGFLNELDEANLSINRIYNEYKTQTVGRLLPVTQFRTALVNIKELDLSKELQEELQQDIQTITTKIGKTISVFEKNVLEQIKAIVINEDDNHFARIKNYDSCFLIFRKIKIFEDILSTSYEATHLYTPLLNKVNIIHDATVKKANRVVGGGWGGLKKELKNLIKKLDVELEQEVAEEQERKDKGHEKFNVLKKLKKKLVSDEKDATAMNIVKKVLRKKAALKQEAARRKAEERQRKAEEEERQRKEAEALAARRKAEEEKRRQEALQREQEAEATRLAAEQAEALEDLEKKLEAAKQTLDEQENSHKVSLEAAKAKQQEQSEKIKVLSARIKEAATELATAQKIVVAQQELAQKAEVELATAKQQNDKGKLEVAQQAQEAQKAAKKAQAVSNKIKTDLNVLVDQRRTLFQEKIENHIRDFPAMLDGVVGEIERMDVLNAEELEEFKKLSSNEDGIASDKMKDLWDTIFSKAGEDPQKKLENISDLEKLVETTLDKAKTNKKHEREKAMILLLLNQEEKMKKEVAAKKMMTKQANIQKRDFMMKLRENNRAAQALKKDQETILQIEQEQLAKKQANMKEDFARSNAELEKLYEDRYNEDMKRWEKYSKDLKNQLVEKDREITKTGRLYYEAITKRNKALEGLRESVDKERNMEAVMEEKIRNVMNNADKILNDQYYENVADQDKRSKIIAALNNSREQLSADNIAREEELKELRRQLEEAKTPKDNKLHKALEAKNEWNGNTAILLAMAAMASGLFKANNVKPYSEQRIKKDELVKKHIDNLDRIMSDVDAIQVDIDATKEVRRTASFGKKTKTRCALEKSADLLYYKVYKTNLYSSQKSKRSRSY